MKVAIITVAGIASRFNETLEKEALKCIYYESDPHKTILFGLLVRTALCDKVILVGGYQFEKLKHYIDMECMQYRNKIDLVVNPSYREYGSGYSLYLGLEKAKTYEADEIIFAEGDLYVDEESFDQLIHEKGNRITITSEPIVSDKAVVVYVNNCNKLRYLYNSSHGCLEIKEPFKAVFNSGQVWKFTETERLFQILTTIPEAGLHGTNLEIIQRYYGELEIKNIGIIHLKLWINCNTIHDYHRMLTCLEGEIVK